MFPGRLPWVALGSGEALNEHVTGAPWPTKPLRMQRLSECVEIMRALWRGEEVDHRGLVTVHEARLWSLPEEPPRAGRRRDERRDRALGGGLGRRADHRQPARREAAPGAGRVPGRAAVAARSCCRCTCPYAATDEEALAHRGRAVARQLRADAAGLGSHPAGAVRGGDRARAAGGGRPQRARLRGPRPARRVAPGVPRPRLRRALPAPRRARQHPSSSSDFGTSVLPALRDAA